MPSSDRLWPGGQPTRTPAASSTPTVNIAVIRSRTHGSGAPSSVTGPTAASLRESQGSGPLAGLRTARGAERRTPPSGLDSLAVSDLRDVHALAERRGHAAGLSLAQQAMEEAVLGASAFAATLEAAVPRDAATLADLIVRLALAVAGRVLEAEVAADPTRLVELLERAISAVNGSPEVHVLLHPAAVDPVRQAWERAHGTTHLGKRWQFAADRSLGPGDCEVRYDHGFVDAGIESQLRTIGEALDERANALLRPNRAGVMG